MNFVDYSIGYLRQLKFASEAQISTVRIIDEIELCDPDYTPSMEILESLTMWKVDIEQAIKDKEFERDQTTLPPIDTL